MNQPHYKRRDGKLYFKDAWVACGQVVVYSGEVGQVGEWQGFSRNKQRSDDENAFEQLASARRDGYRHAGLTNFDILRMDYAIVECDIELAQERSQKLLLKLNHTLLKYYLGSVDGGGVREIDGTEVLDACCLVIDCEIAESVIRRELAGTEFGDYQRIYRDTNPKPWLKPL